MIPLRPLEHEPAIARRVRFTNEGRREEPRGWPKLLYWTWLESGFEPPETNLVKDVAELRGELRALRDAVEVLGPALDESRRQTFETLVAWWKADGVRSTSSFLRDYWMHPAYRRIIGMGEPALPLILAELARSPDHWGLALESISGENPIQAKDAGHLKAMTHTWLSWGAAKGLCTPPPDADRS